MELKQIVSKQILLDTGNENDIFNTTHSIMLNNNEELFFKTRELIELSELEKKGENNLIKSILEISPSIKKTEPIPSVFVYKNDEELPVYIKLYDNYYLLIALGEFQYGRYKLWLEGVFEKKSKHSII